MRFIKCLFFILVIHQSSAYHVCSLTDKQFGLQDNNQYLYGAGEASLEIEDAEAQARKRALSALLLKFKFDIKSDSSLVEDNTRSTYTSQIVTKSSFKELDTAQTIFSVSNDERKKHCVVVRIDIAHIRQVHESKLESFHKLYLDTKGLLDSNKLVEFLAKKKELFGQIESLSDSAEIVDMIKVIQKDEVKWKNELNAVQKELSLLEVQNLKKFKLNTINCLIAPLVKLENQLLSKGIISVRNAPLASTGLVNSLLIRCDKQRAEEVKMIDGKFFVNGEIFITLVNPADKNVISSNGDGKVLGVGNSRDAAFRSFENQYFLHLKALFEKIMELD